MAISVVTTLYKSAPYIDEFVSRTKALMSDHDELIMVDDGSPDNSLEIARRHASTDGRIVLVELSRNFGHHPAILAGLSQTRNDRIFLVDSDLEEEPELLREFSSVMDASGVDVVFGIHDHAPRVARIKRLRFERHHVAMERRAADERPLPRGRELSPPFQPHAMQTVAGTIHGSLARCPRD